MVTKKSAATKEPTASEKLNVVGIEAICKQIAGGMSLRAWAAKNGFCQQTVINWIDADKDRVGQYARAREAREEAKFESLEEIGEQAVKAETAIEVQGLRLKSDNLKWTLARMNPKKYGDKLELAGNQESPLTVQILRLSDADKPD